MQTKFQTGGIILGNSNTRDNVVVMNNCREIVINRKQQRFIMRLAYANQPIKEPLPKIFKQGPILKNNIYKRYDCDFYMVVLKVDKRNKQGFCIKVCNHSGGSDKYLTKGEWIPLNIIHFNFDLIHLAK